MRSEAEVDQMIKELIDRTKGDYIFQGVSFNKKSGKQINLLKHALMHGAFSGFIKTLLWESCNTKSNRNETPVANVYRVDTDEGPGDDDTVDEIYSGWI